MNKPEPMTDEQIKYATLEKANDLLDHIYEEGTASEGVTPRLNRYARAVAAARDAQWEQMLAAQEPFAEFRTDDGEGHVVLVPFQKPLNVYDKMPLYAAPQPAKEPSIPAPPEAQTDAEKRAYAFGWFKAMETVRNAQPAQPATTHTVLLEQALEALEWCEPAGTVGQGGIDARNAAIAAIKEALK